MSDKDQFTFDDKDDFPESDLSSAFSDSEFEADNPAPDVQQTLEQTEGNKSMNTGISSGSGGSRTRILLIVLLLVVAGGAGVYYFMDLGGSTPVVPTAVAPAQKTQKTVALPPQPAKPVPVQQQAAGKPEPALAVKAVEKHAQEASAKSGVQAVAPAQKPSGGDRPVAQTEPAPASKPAQHTEEPQISSVPATMPGSGQAIASVQAAGGPFTLDAGSYLFESNRDVLLAKIDKLGYKSLVTPVDAKLDMTRLRLGTYRKEDVRQALDFARSIEPGAYTAPAGDGFVIYAGTFLKKGTVDKLTKRFMAEGVKVHPEPVQVVRTLSRIRFGSFATREEAMAAANAAGKVGVMAVVVKAK